jgi:ribosome-associated toxin RatA of RatAB toxin-antitoxin module
LVIDAPVNRVYELAQDIERLPEFLPNVERVTVQRREHGKVLSEWAGRVPEFNRNIAWVEEDVWDDAAHRCDFTLVSGDWDQYDGSWSFEEENGRTRVVLDIRYEYNVPLIGALIKKLLQKLVARSADETLEGLRRMAEVKE